MSPRMPLRRARLAPAIWLVLALVIAALPATRAAAQSAPALLPTPTPRATALPARVPTGAPAAAPSAPAVPALTATPALTLTTAADKVLYLTFDDGPFSPNTEAILDLLAEHGARATFFVVGTQARARPALLERIYAEGHGLANHTWGHRSLKGASWATFSEQVTLLGDLLGERESRCLRPPYGDVDGNTRTWAEALGYRVVLYSVDPEDWRLPGAQVVAQRILDRAKPGAVVVLHDGGSNRAQTIAALAAVLPALQAEGYRFEALCRDSFPAPQGAPAPAPPAEAGWAQGAISAPAFGSTLSGAVEVAGTASAAEFRKWQLDLLLFGNAADATFLALGETPVAAPALLFTWDTRPFPDGRHTLRLRVVRNDGNYMEWYTQVVIANG